MHYLDNAATTRVLPEAAEAAVHAMCEEFGNPSSLHRMGLEASHLLEDSRRTVASALGCLPEEVYFTACGTESTNISLRGAAHLNRHKKGRIITTEIEHAATVNTAKQLAADGFDVVFLAPDATGHITPEVLSEALTEDTILLSCQLVNNEIGTVQPVEQLGKLLKAKAPKALFHIDAVQGLCRVRLTPKKWNCDLMSVSGHKIGAPKGIGALYVKKGLRLPPLTFGGGQERGMRPGTEAVPNIAAFAKACEIRMAHFDEDYAHVQELADYLKQQVGGRAAGCGDKRRGRYSACCQSFHARLQERGHAACTRGGRGLHFQRLSLLQGQAERCAQGTRSAEGAHGQRAARFVCTVQHKGRCGCFCCSGQKGRENVPQIS